MYTVKSTSAEGVYYLANHWGKHKALWVKPDKVKPEMLFKSVAAAKASLTKLLKVMPEYSTDTFEIIAV